MLPYWARARAFARANTKTFSPWKALPTVLAAGARWYFWSRTTVIETLQIIAAAVSTYLLCYLVDFLWKLMVVAPAAIDLENRNAANALQHTIDRLTDVPLIEQNRRTMVRQKLEEIPEPFREVTTTGS